ncbi:MAG: hypothetical protein RBS27_08305 [Giesbergeria sp.]|nr:hypothetical protein [Giesbergeria sp.]
MPRRHPPPSRPDPVRALLEFAVTVVLALLAWAALLVPDATVQSADAMSGVVDGLGRVMEAAGRN